jgi:hypothetical protein
LIAGARVMGGLIDNVAFLVIFSSFFFLCTTSAHKHSDSRSGWLGKKYVLLGSLSMYDFYVFFMLWFFSPNFASFIMCVLRL